MNPDPAPNGGNRRAFLRYAAVGGLTAVTALLLARRFDGKCTSAGICRGCAVYDDCNLPQALSAKEVLSGKSLIEP